MLEKKTANCLIALVITLELLLLSSSSIAVANQAFSQSATTLATSKESSIKPNVMRTISENTAYDKYSFSDNSAMSVAQSISGNLSILLLPVQFLDVSATTSLNALRNSIVSSVASYYAQVSYGKVSLNFSLPFSSWFTLPQTEWYYGHDNLVNIDVNKDQLIKDSLDAAAPHINYNDYGYVIIAHAGQDQAMSGSTSDIWSSSYLGRTYSYGGVMLGINILSEFDPYGVYAHEFGHALELPDLYDVTYSGKEFVGSWSLMDYGSWLNPPSSIMSPEKMWLGWIPAGNASIVNEGQIRNVTLSPLEETGPTLSAKIMVDSTYYTAEYRRRILTDSALPMEGVILSYVDESLESGYGIVRIINANPADPTLDHAAFNAGMMFINRTNEVAVRVWSLTPQGATIMVQKGFADLTVQNINASGLLADGKQVYFDAYIKNIGVTPSNYAVASLTIDGTTFQNANVPAIDPNATSIVRFGPWTAKAGIHTVQVVVDVYDNVVEKSETNNSFSKNFEVSTGSVVVDKFFATKAVADVNSTQEVFLHARWDNGSDIAGGVIYINGSSYLTNSTGWITLEVTSSTVGKTTWHVTGVDVNGVSTYSQEAPDPQIIWNLLEVVDSGVSDDRCDVGSTQKVWVSLRYAYDGRIFDDSWGSVWIDDKKAEWDNAEGQWFILDSNSSVGKTDYATPSNFEDRLYSLTLLTGKKVSSIIWDRIDIVLRSSSERVSIGSEAPINWTATYQYDGTEFQGNVTLNENTKIYIIEKVQYTVKNVSDKLYGLKAFTSNTVDVLFDEMMTKTDVNTLMPGIERITVKITFKSDGIPVTNASVTVSGKQAENTGSGVYVVELNNWSPYVDPRIEIDAPYFSKQVDAPSVAIGNLVFLMGLPSLILIVTGVILAKRKTEKKTV